MKTLAATLIAPEDLLDAARTLPLGDIATCAWLSDWVPATVFLDWARRGLAQADAYGLSNAVTYAKRAALRLLPLLYPTPDVPCIPRKREVWQRFEREGGSPITLN